MRRVLKLLLGRAVSLEADERGSLSIVSVFTLLALVMLLGMVMNWARQVDQKVKLQNAADSATYAGGIVLTRGMNTLAFTNHLLCDVFALTAYLREARDRNAESLTPELLDNWQRVAPAFIGSEFPPFDQLGYAIEEKIPYEREMVLTFSDWAAAASEMMLPVFEEILAQEMIPEFQRALTESTPRLAQYAADEIAQLHGDAWPMRSDLHAVLWRTMSDPVGGMSEAERRTLPVVDPVQDVALDLIPYQDAARRQRERLANRYLEDWNAESLETFDVLGKMSQFSHLWRIFTCGQLRQLLEDEYPDRNLPFQIRDDVSQILDVNEHVERDFMFVGVVYDARLRDRVPGVFQNPLAADSQTYSQIMLFVPRRRLVKVYPNQNPDPAGGGVGETLGGVPGDPITIPAPVAPPRGSAPARTPDGQELEGVVVRQSAGWHPQRWDLLTQNWTTQLVPATAPSLSAILSTPPYVNGVTGYDVPNLFSLTEEDLRWLSHH